MSALDRFVEGWEKLRQNTIATAQDMPEEHYDSAPFEGMWSFRKQLAHILNVGDVFFDGLSRGAFDPAKFKLDNYGTRAKDEIVAALKNNLAAQKQQLQQFAQGFWDEQRQSFDGSQRTGGELLQMLKEHEIGHCNQLYLYLRAKSILPPPTRKRLEAKAAK
jgi:uncharacterized damage-inducible protein DinB